MRWAFIFLVSSMTVSAFAQTKVLRHAPTLPSSVRINFDDPDAFKKGSKQAKKDAKKDEKSEKKELKKLNKFFGKKLDSLNDFRAKAKEKRSLKEGLMRLDEKGIVDLKGVKKYKKYKKDTNQVKSLLKEYAKDKTDYPVVEMIDKKGVDSTMVAGMAKNYAGEKLGSKYNDISQFGIYKDSVRVIFNNDSVRGQFIKALAADNQYYQQANAAKNGEGDSLAVNKLTGGMGLEDYLASKGLSGAQNEALSSNKMSKEDLVPSMEEYFSQFGIRPEELDLENKEAAKKKAGEVAKEKYFNHFEGHEDKLTKAKTNLEAIKKKRTFKDFLQYFFDQQQEAMKEKSLKERLSFGGYFQFQRGNPHLLDFSPMVGYRATGKVTTGVGFTYRQSFGGDKGNYANQPPKDMLGYRTFVDYNFILGLYFHAEFESLRTDIPSPTADDEVTRSWVNGYLFGLGRDFRIKEGIFGSAQVLYNFNHQDGKTPYISPWQFKFGFKYQ